MVRMAVQNCKIVFGAGLGPAWVAPTPANMARVGLCIPGVTQAAGITGGGRVGDVARHGSRLTSRKLLKMGCGRVCRDLMDINILTNLREKSSNIEKFHGHRLGTAKNGNRQI